MENRQKIDLVERVLRETIRQHSLLGTTLAGATAKIWLGSLIEQAHWILRPLYDVEDYVMGLEDKTPTPGTVRFLRCTKCMAETGRFLTEATLGTDNMWRCPTHKEG